MTLRILVTGAAGLLGGALVRGLAGTGRIVFGATRLGARDEKGYDLSDAKAVATLLDAANPDVIVHAAGRIRSPANATEFFERDNVVATANLVSGAQSRPLAHFIHISTISVYSGNGPFTENSPVAATEPYGDSKLRAEQVCLSAANATFRPVILRLGGLHGPPRRDGVVAEFFRRGRAGDPIRIPEPKTVMTLTFIEDVVEVVDRILGLDAPAAQAIFNVATRESVQLGDLATMISDLTGGRSKIVPDLSGRSRNRVMDSRRIREWLGVPSMSLAEHLVRCSAHS